MADCININSIKLAKTFLKFNSASPTPFHCVNSATEMLKDAGFKKLKLKSETNFWEIKPCQKFYVTRNESSLIAFQTGKNYEPGQGAMIIAAHTDSPGLHIKPISKIKSNGYNMVGVEVYGGGHFDSWFDRDLSVAGRVLVKNENGEIESRLVKINRPILSIPRLAIHLETAEERTKGFKPNFEKHLKAILSIKTSETNEIDGSEIKNKPSLNSFEKISDSHHIDLLKLISNEINCKIDQIIDFKLFLYDTQEGSIGGINNEFIHAARLDNQMMSFVAIKALIDSDFEENNEEVDLGIKMVSLFDNEEVGSVSNRGADSSYLLNVLKRITGNDLIDICLENSFIVSADMAHAIHPNYSDKHEINHKPILNQGLVIKYNANERYATTDLSSAIFSEIAKKNKIKLQKFCIRQDLRCGSTVGPFLSSVCGIRTIDVGIPQLAMHSIRETCGVEDINSTVKLFKKFFLENYRINGPFACRID